MSDETERPGTPPGPGGAVPPLAELIPGDVPADELERLARADAILRATPGPPESSSDTLAARVARIPSEVDSPRRRTRRGSRRTLLPAGRWLPYAAALAACGAAFAIGFVVRGGEPDQAVADSVTLNATPRGPGDAVMVLEVLPQDDAGNWALLADVSGLDPLGDGEYYELWLTRDRRVVASCGRFTVDELGRATDVWLNAPYRFRDYDDWVVTRESPARKPRRSAWLLRGPVTV